MRTAGLTRKDVRLQRACCGPPIERGRPIPFRRQLLDCPKLMLPGQASQLRVTNGSADARLGASQVPLIADGIAAVHM
jgi:hypothetical protein